MSERTPAISIIMPAWRAEATLTEAVGSVAAQSRQDWELILAPDGSREEAAPTLEVAGRLAAADPRIRGLEPPGAQTGAGLSRNRALALARGRWLAFLDADDLWMPEKLARQTAFMEETGTGLSYTGFLRRDMGSGRESAVRPPPRVTRESLRRGNVIGCLTVMLDRDRIEPLTGPVRMTDMPLRQDYALWLQILGALGEARGLPEPLAIHRRSPRSLSSGKGRATWWTWRLYRDQEGLSVPRAALCLASHLGGRLRRG